MAFKTIVARFAGSKCRRCGGTIKVGQSFRYGGRANCWHLSKECPAGKAQAQPVATSRQPAHSGYDCGDPSDLEGAGDSVLLGPSFPDHDLIH